MAKASGLGTSAISIKTTDSINVKLSNNEISERAIISCKVAKELDDAEQEFATIKKEHKARIDGISSKLKSLQHCVETGEEFRQVECNRLFDLARGVTWLEFEGKRYLERPPTQKEMELLQHGDMEDHMPGDLF
jgi:hypothetical protein